MAKVPTRPWGDVWLKETSSLEREVPKKPEENWQCLGVLLASFEKRNEMIKQQNMPNPKKQPSDTPGCISFRAVHILYAAARTAETGARSVRRRGTGTGPQTRAGWVASVKMGVFFGFLEVRKRKAAILKVHNFDANSGCFAWSVVILGGT